MQELSGATPIANMLTGGMDETFMCTDASGTSTFLADALQSTLVLADASGNVQTQYTVDPFGATTASGATSTNAAQFAGRENGGTGLYFYRARYYSPAIGRFLSWDPIGLHGGMNPYVYAFSNPVMLTDPTGLKPLPYDQVVDLVRKSNQSGLSDELVVCLVWKESGFDPAARSRSSSARGLTQMTRGAARDVGTNYNRLGNPSTSIAAGTKYLSVVIDRFGGDVTTGLEHFGTGAGYADDILDCEKCLKERNQQARQPDPICSDPKKCLERIHK